MKSRKLEVRAAVGIFVIALSFRLFFIFSSLKFSAQGDSKYYIGPAYQFSRSLHSWPEIKESINRMAWRGPVYPLFLSLLMKAGQTRLQAARLAQAFLDSLTCVLIYFLARRFGSRKTGLIAGLLAAFYTPFLFSATAILQECLTTFLVVLTTLLIVRAAEKPLPRRFFIGGVSLALLMLSRAVMLYLPLFLAVPVGLFIRRSKKKLPNCAGFAGGLAAIILPWVILLSVVPPVYSVTNVAGFANYPWILNFLKSDGWSPDAADARQFTPDDPGLGGEVFADSSPSGGERFLCLGRGLYLYPRLIASILIKNLHRLWFYPYLIYWPPFILSDAQLYFFHRAIVILATIGLPLSFASGNIALIPLALLVHSSLVISLVNVEARYNVPFMPMVILLSAIGIDCLTAALGKVRRLPRKKPYLAAVGAAVLFTLLTGIFTLPVIIAIFPDTEVLTARWLRVGLLNLWLLSLLWLLFRLVKIQRDRRWALFTAASFLVIVVGMVDFKIHADKRWGGWSTRLSSPAQRVRQEFVLPDDFDPTHYQNPVLKIDMRRRPDRGFPVVAKADGRRFPAPFKARKNDLDRKLTARRGRLPSNVRQWVEVPIEMELLEDRHLIVDLYFEEMGRDKGNYLDVWGDYRLEPVPDFYEGPALPSSSRPEFLASLPKLLEEWDMRLDKRIPLTGGLVAASRLGRDWSYSDLSPDRGKQTGVYRIRLRLSKPADPPCLDPLTQEPVVDYLYF